MKGMSAEKRKSLEKEVKEGGSSLLHAFSYVGNEYEVRQILNSGNVDTEDKVGRTSIFWAITGHRTKSGANASHCDKEGYFPLYLAAQERNTDIARALIEAKADLNAILDRNTEGTALLAAVRSRHKPLIKLLIDAGCDLSRRATQGCQPLTAACEGGLFGITKMLLDSGAQVNGMNAGGSTALFAAARTKQFDIMKLLLKRGADIEHIQSQGRSILHCVATDGHDDVLKYLIKAGADLKLSDDCLCTPLHLVAQFGHRECVWTLLCAGTNIDARTCGGETALHTAASVCDTQIIEMLLSSGADVHARDNQGRTPLIHASASRDARRLDATPGVLKEVPPAAAALAGEDIKAVELLLDAGSDINAANEDGHTAIVGALNVPLLKALLDRGASAKLIDKEGYSLLHLAALRGATAPVLCTLYKAGADPLLLNKDGHTAADVALQYGHSDAAKMLELLAAKHQPSQPSTGSAASATRRQPVIEGELADAPIYRAVNFVDTDGRLKMRLVDDYRKEEKRKKEERVNGMMNAFEKLLKEHVAAPKPEGICLHCDKPTHRKCSGCGASYFCSEECEVAARFVCCG